MIVIIIAINNSNCSPNWWLVDIILTSAGNPTNLPFGFGLQHPYGWWFWGIADQVGCSTLDSEYLNRVPRVALLKGGPGLAREWDMEWDMVKKHGPKTPTMGSDFCVKWPCKNPAWVPWIAPSDWGGQTILRGTLHLVVDCRCFFAFRTGCF
jgi:hypothetical protein